MAHLFDGRALYLLVVLILILVVVGAIWAAWLIPAFWAAIVGKLALSTIVLALVAYAVLAVWAQSMRS